MRDGRIERVGAGESAGPATTSAMIWPAFFAMPGLIDAHAHIAQGPYAVSIVNGAPLVEMVVDARFTRFNAMMALALELTTVRNPGGPTEAASHYDTMLARGDWVGPEALHAGAIMEPRPFDRRSVRASGHGREWNAEAARQAHAGMTYFKLYQDLTEDELVQGIAAARANGLIPIAHLNAVSWTRAAELGVAQVEHALPTSAALLPKRTAPGFVRAIPPPGSCDRSFELVDLGGPEITELLRTLRERHTPRYAHADGQRGDLQRQGPRRDLSRSNDSRFYQPERSPRRKRTSRRSLRAGPTATRLRPRRPGARS